MSLTRCSRSGNKHSTTFRESRQQAAPVVLRDPQGKGPNLSLNRVLRETFPASEADCTSSCPQQSRGGSRTFNQRWGDPRYPWRYKPGRDFVVLQDPSGNLFCVVEKADG